MNNQQISAITVKELVKGNMQIRCKQEYKSVSTGYIVSVNERITKHVFEET